MADLAFFNNTMYSCNFSWTTYEGVVNEVNPNTGDVSKILLDMEARGVRMLMEYRIGGINGSEDIFISGMGQDVLVVNPVTKTIKHAFQTGIANGSGVRQLGGLIRHRATRSVAALTIIAFALWQLWSLLPGAAHG